MERDRTSSPIFCVEEMQEARYRKERKIMIIMLAEVIIMMMMMVIMEATYEGESLQEHTFRFREV